MLFFHFNFTEPKIHFTNTGNITEHFSAPSEPLTGFLPNIRRAGLFSHRRWKFQYYPKCFSCSTKQLGFLWASFPAPTWDGSSMSFLLFREVHTRRIPSCPMIDILLPLAPSSSASSDSLPFVFLYPFVSSFFFFWFIPSKSNLLFRLA